MNIKTSFLLALLTLGISFVNASNIKKQQTFNLCGDNVYMGEIFNKHKFLKWKKTNIIQTFSFKLIEYGSIKDHKDYTEECFFYTKTNNALNENNKIVKLKKQINTKNFVNIPDYLYSKDMKFISGQIVLINGKKIRTRNLNEFKKMINLYKNKIIFLKATYKSKKYTGNFVEIFNKNSIYKFKTILLIKNNNLNPIKKSPYDVTIPKYYMNRTKQIMGINKMVFDHAEPAYNIKIKNYNY